jgi:RimJ/RimL family protein N-acetyltransferase/acyl carrier protein
MKSIGNTSLHGIIMTCLAKQIGSHVEITTEKRIKEDLGLSSIKLVFFLTETVNHLDLSLADFSDSELLNLKRVSDIYSLLKRKREKLIEEKLFSPDLLIENEDLQLRIVTQNDIPALSQIASDSSIWKYYLLELSNPTDLELYVRNLLNEHLNRRNIPFVIVDKRNENNIVGMSSFGNISLPDRRIEIGWTWIGKSFQGTGINSICKNLLINFAFEKLDFIRVEFKTDVLNAQARKALLKIGATEEGILRSHAQMHGNRRRDTIFYSFLREEWPKKKME